MIGLTLASVFVASFGLVIGTYVFLSRRSLARQAAARRRIRGGSASDSDVRLWRDDSASAIPLLDAWLKRAGHTRRLREDIRASGLQARPATVMLSAVVLSGAGFLFGSQRGSLPLAIVFGSLGLVAPYLFLRWKKRKRVERFESQLPEAIDLLVNALRAGYSFQAAMELVGEEIQEPLGGEFSQFYEEQRLGMDVRSALLALQGRIRSLDLKMFVTAILIQRDTGGNLTEVLTNIGHVIRERFRLQGEMKTLTTEVRLSAKVLGALPVLVLLGVSVIHPGFLTPLFKHPVGHLILAGAGTFQLLGFLAMWRLSKVEY